MSCYCSRPAIAVVQAHLSLLEKRQMGRPCLSLEMQLKGKNPYLEIHPKKLISFSELCPLKQKVGKHILECFLSQGRHFVVGQLLFRSILAVSL